MGPAGEQTPIFKSPITNNRQKLNFNNQTVGALNFAVEIPLAIALHIDTTGDKCQDTAV
jgi:hypothetical protein